MFSFFFFPPLPDSFFSLKPYIKQLLWKFLFPFKCFHISRLCSYDLIKLSYQGEIIASGLGKHCKAPDISLEEHLSGVCSGKEAVGGIAELLGLLSWCLPSHTCLLYISIFLLRQPTAALGEKPSGTTVRSKYSREEIKIKCCTWVNDLLTFPILSCSMKVLSLPTLLTNPTFWSPCKF